MSGSIMIGTLASLVRAIETGLSVVWLIGDHVQRRIAGRRSLFEEMFDGLDFGLTEGDVMPPFDRAEEPGEVETWGLGERERELSS
jgi:hypothetical protein